ADAGPLQGRLAVGGDRGGEAVAESEDGVGEEDGRREWAVPGGGLEVAKLGVLGEEGGARGLDGIGEQVEGGELGGGLEVGDGGWWISPHRVAPFIRRPWP
ncbi:MAG: hypothetical protein R6V85_17180, partial [Polyangia bacterium]